MNTQAKRIVCARYAVVLAVALTSTTAGLSYNAATGFGWWAQVSAAEAGHGGGQSGGHSGGGGGGSHGGGHDKPGSDPGGDEHGDGHTPGPKGPGSQGGGRGGGGHEAGRGGGKAVEDQVLRGRRPVWAREGIPEVELGRLNVSRAPGHVLARAEGEALATYQPAMSGLYSLDADQAAALLASNFRGVARYDSPLQNLALYRDVMTFGDTQLKSMDPNLVPASQLDLAAIFLGSASDKTIPISEDTVTALNRILGLVEMDPEDRALLASKAETVRQAIFIGHGPTEDH
jgi:hypothetical protein